MIYTPTVLVRTTLKVAIFSIGCVWAHATTPFAATASDEAIFTGEAYGDNYLDGSQNVDLTHVDAIDANMIVEGLAKHTWDAPAMSLGEAVEIARQGTQATLDSSIDRKKETSSTKHPFQVLVAICLTWLAPFCMIVALVSGTIAVLRFQASHDWQTFLRQYAHWGLLAGISGIMSVLTW